MGKDIDHETADREAAVRLGAEVYEDHITPFGEYQFPVAYKFDDTAAAIKFKDNCEGRQVVLYIDGDGASWIGNEQTATRLEPKPLDFDYRADGLKKSALEGGRALARAAATGDERAADYMAMAGGDEKTAYNMALAEAAGRLMNQALIFREQRQGAPSPTLDDAVNEARKLGIVSLPPLRSQTVEQTVEEPELRIGRGRGFGRETD